MSKIIISMIKELYKIMMDVERTLREQISFEKRNMPISKLDVAIALFDVLMNLNDISSLRNRILNRAYIEYIHVMEDFIQYFYNSVSAMKHISDELHEYCTTLKQVKVESIVCKATMGTKLSEFRNILDHEHRQIARVVTKFYGVLESLDSSYRSIKQSMERLVSNLKMTGRVCRDITGKRCFWFTDEDIEKLDMSMSAIANDLAYAIHRVAEKVANIAVEAEKRIMVIGRTPIYLIADKPNEELLEAVKAWAMAVTEGAKMRLYKREDYEALEATISQTHRAGLRVGSAEGHLTHVIFNGEKWVLRYYDIDEVVNRMMSELWRSKGFETSILEDGVEVLIPKGRLRDTMIVLALATSMDLRLTNIDIEKERLEEIERRIAQRR